MACPCHPDLGFTEIKDLTGNVGYFDLRPWIDLRRPRLTIHQQCELLGLPRSTYYYQPRPESAENLLPLRSFQTQDSAA